LVKLIRDLEGMIRIGKAYTGKLELAFALVCSKRIVQIDLGLHSLLSHLPSALHILDAQFTPTVKGLLSSVKVAVNGDFRDLEIRRVWEEDCGSKSYYEERNLYGKW